ncbi:MAG: AbrB/MazE/SpoVT family DNA-binding domain-containing protein [Nanoarchaeota archaeon]
MGKMIKAKIKKWGNSYGIVIPKETMDSENLKENEEVEFMIVKPTNVLRETFGMLKGKLKKPTAQMMREMDRELYPEDYKDD